MQPLFSVIIPCYNRAHILGRAIDSVIAQVYANWELVIVDDGSSDNSWIIQVGSGSFSFHASLSK